LPHFFFVSGHLLIYYISVRFSLLYPSSEGSNKENLTEMSEFKTQLKTFLFRQDFSQA